MTTINVAYLTRADRDSIMKALAGYASK